jgi:hypothetical protein
LGCAELDGPAEGFFELQLHLGQVQQARRVLGQELDQEFGVAAGVEVVTQGGSVEGEVADAVGVGERGEERVVEGQARSELHTVMMPHSEGPARVGRRRPTRRLGYRVSGGQASQDLGGGLVGGVASADAGLAGWTSCGVFGPPAKGRCSRRRPAYALMHLGIAPAVTLGMKLIVGAAPPRSAGAAAGAAETGNELGGALGIALIGALGAVVYRAGMPVPGPAGDTLAGAVDHRPALPPQVLDRAVDAFTTAVHVTAVASAALVLLTAVLLVALLHHILADPTTGRRGRLVRRTGRRTCLRRRGRSSAAARSRAG